MPKYRNPSTPNTLRFTLIAFACLSLFALATCGKDSPTKPKPPVQPPPPPPVQPVPTRITITPATATLMSIGQTVKLKAAVLDQNGQPITNANILWSSNNPAVATVSSSGLVTAVMNGAAQITATAGSVSAGAEVRVRDDSRDRNALIALYNSTNGPSWINNTNWLSDEPVHTWRGVRTNTLGEVTSLFISQNNLSGVVPPEIGNLQKLTHLDVRDNQLTGSIPPELGQLQNLKVLNLERNQLTGSIPPELGQLQNVTQLYLTYNQLTGSIPPELGQLKNLEELSSRENQLSGNIPPELGQLQNLKGLYLDYNQFTGTIPSELSQLQNLTYLWLGANQLTGSIPPELGQLEKLRSLSIFGNQLTGIIPPELGQLQNLVELILGDPHAYGNLLTGTIPPELGQLKNLKRLSLYGHHLTGTIPPELGQLQNLQYMDLSSNQELFGLLPDTFLNLTMLIRLNINDTRLCVAPTKEFHSWISRIQLIANEEVNCSSPDHNALIALYNQTNGLNWNVNTNWASSEPLSAWHGITTDADGNVTGIELEGNNLIGLLPGQLSSLTGLSSLNLSSNPGLTGAIPLSFTRLNLEELLFEGTKVCAPSNFELQQWLSGILQRSIVNCTDNRPDYYVLEELYNSTNGPNWTNNSNWMSEMPLTTWYGVETSANGEVTALALWSNNLQGSIPPEIGQLQSLTHLDLRDNNLQGSIPPEFEALENLEFLNLYTNGLAGNIPPEFGKLKKLRSLSLGDSQLSGSIPIELGQLENLEFLSLDHTGLQGNIPPELGQLKSLRFLKLAVSLITGAVPAELGQLKNLESLILQNWRQSGPIPPELGQLQNLSVLSIENSGLTGPIPPEFGQLSLLTRINLSSNQLIGPIPPELGRLGMLRDLHLSQNRLTGNIPRSFGELSSLESLRLTGNVDMSGVLPLTLIRLNLEDLRLAGTQLCALDESTFRDWLIEIPDARVERCVTDRKAAYLVQATQSLKHPVPLVAGEDALLRVFVTSEIDMDVDMPHVRATFYEDGGEVFDVDIPSQETPIPMMIVEADLSVSANVRIPGSVLTSGLEMVIEIDPDGEFDPSLGIGGRLPEMGRVVVDVVDMPPFELTLVPFLWEEDPDYSQLSRVESLTPDSDLFRYVRDLLPVEEFALIVHEPVSISVDPVGGSQSSVLGLTSMIRTMESGTGHWMGVLRGSMSGHAHRPGNASVSTLDARVIAHELGHNLDLLHAPCDSPLDLDPDYPYPDGSIGAWGYDLLYDQLVDPNTPDLMSYCGPEFWISEYNFSKAMSYRLSQAQETYMAVASLPSTNGLLLWGGVNENGEIALEPAFVVDAPSVLPQMDGPYMLTGEDADGGRIFSFTFGMAEIADGDGGAFAFIIPARAEWADQLSHITLSGPEGVVTLGGDDDPTAALLLDPGTGKVRGLLRDWPEPSTTLQAARRSSPEPGLEVVISTGVPNAADWDR